jgi:hypothetical protein
MLAFLSINVLPLILDDRDGPDSDAGGHIWPSLAIGLHNNALSDGDHRRRLVDWFCQRVEPALRRLTIKPPCVWLNVDCISQDEAERLLRTQLVWQCRAIELDHICSRLLMVAIAEWLNQPDNGGDDNGTDSPTAGGGRLLYADKFDAQLVVNLRWVLT